jgi:hypothetical protein
MVNISDDDLQVIIESLDESIFQLGLRVKEVHPANTETIKAMKGVIVRFETTKANITS